MEDPLIKTGNKGKAEVEQEHALFKLQLNSKQKILQQ